ncbi:MAG: hypothetical protein H6739_33380 [Alphaproteobacteria bacterium]|nr:hypothetical protein [Alphaproteobacteria bacterium]
MLPLLLLAPALAAPRFVADTEGDAELAEAVWQAAVYCTARAPRTHDTVTIARDLDPTRLAGRMDYDADGLFHISLRPGSSPYVLAHEVAHAWVHDGPPALVEGRTEALNLCVVENLPDRIPWVDGLQTDLERMPDLRTWVDPEPSSRGYDVVGQGLEAAARLFRALTRVLPREQLWSDRYVAWAPLEEDLLALGPQGERVVDALRGGAEAQRQLLIDPDHDGAINLVEAWQGTDPRRWDTDGDGWWDGAPPHPPEAVPLPGDGRHVCVPWIRADGAPADVLVRGNLRGFNHRTLTFRDRRPSETVRLTPELTRLDGGLWLEVAASDVVPNPFCHQGPRTLVIGRDTAAGTPLEELLRAVEQAQERADGLLSWDGRQVRVAVEEVPQDTVMLRAGSFQDPSPQVIVPEDRVRGGERTMRTLGALVVAWHRLGLSGDITHQSPAAAWALVFALLPDAQRGALVNATAREIRQWRRRAEACADGWAGLLSGEAC